MTKRLTDVLNIVIGIRFERCRLKDFTERVKDNPNIPEDNKLKYKRCYECQGQDKNKYCYVEPYNNVFK